VFVGNLPSGTHEAMLRAAFGQFGTVLQVAFLPAQFWNQPPTAMVGFADESQAGAAINNMNGKFRFDPSQEPIVVLSQPPGGTQMAMARPGGYDGAGGFGAAGRAARSRDALQGRGGEHRCAHAGGR